MRFFHRNSREVRISLLTIISLPKPYEYAVPAWRRCTLFSFTHPSPSFYLIYGLLEEKVKGKGLFSFLCEMGSTYPVCYKLERRQINFIQEVNWVFSVEEHQHVDRQVFGVALTASGHC